MSKTYKESINRVLDYIQENLEEELSLEQLSEIACYSKYHFNRIFTDHMGESAYQYIKRLRLEKSAELLQGIHHLSITDIALRCGFENSSSFAKSFKNHFRKTPTEWRTKVGECFVKQPNAANFEHCDFSIIQGSPVWTYHSKNAVRQVVIEEITPFTFAYIRNIGPYHSDEVLYGEVYNRLLRWAAARGLTNENAIAWHIYHDNPYITEDRKLRVMVGIPIADLVDPSGPVGITSMSGGTFGACRFLLKRDDFTGAWRWMFSHWLANSGYEWDHRETFERRHGESIINGEHYFDIEICIPVAAA